ncbi:hypothetical protein [Variovorax paradoxus]|uniref:Nmad2 family putative nucleotide modification protein n=1 Tax=Variovorax paradoxus TaxID=34073 RepID=UPI001931C012|nr:hypothetical protein INQ48_35670 [Variovorax paradoxus]
MCNSPKMETGAAVLTDQLLNNLSISDLRGRIAAVGSPDDHIVYGYVIATVRPTGSGFRQTGSGPNFEGGFVTLCTCKHGMRTTRSAQQWSDQYTWIVGMTGWSAPFSKRQSLVYLMRVGEAYDSQASLVAALHASGRGHVVEAKASTGNQIGDIMVPIAGRTKLNVYDPASYETPVLGHAHRRNADTTDWHEDINYVALGGARPAMLVGDPELTFVWTHPMVQRRRPGPTRPYRRWTMSEFLDDLDGVQS